MSGAPAGASTSAFRLENVARRYGQGAGARVALEGVSLAIGRGSWLARTTLLGSLWAVGRAARVDPARALLGG
ncbi:MAG: hypothetical protein MUF34_17155 [Polyangiaceae bacterium]|nr:hypothetical protein [Polyangiaceae bacterium]